MRTLVAALALLLLAPSGAHAKPGSDELAAARDHYRRGTTLYDLGKYEEAVAEFQQAYEIRDDPVLLFNIAQSYRLSSKYQEALRFYKTYLRRAPTAKNREDVEAKIADMEKMLEQQDKVDKKPPSDAIRPQPRSVEPEATPQPRQQPEESAPEPPPPPVKRRVKQAPPPEETPEERPTRAETTPSEAEPPPGPPPTPPEPPKPGRTKLIAGITIGVVGLGALGAGFGLGLAAMAKSNEVSTAPIYPGRAAEDSGRLMSTLAIVFDIAGGVLAAGGVALAVLGIMTKAPENKPEDTGVSFVPIVGPGTAGAAMGLRF